MSVQVESGKCAVTIRSVIIGKGQQTYLTLRMFDYVAQDQNTCLKPSSFFSVTASRD